MDVMNKEQAKIAEEAGACAVMALERPWAPKSETFCYTEASPRTSARARASPECLIPR